jgi:hypothetical protein
VELRPIEPPRTFTVGEPPLTLRHCADVELAADEQVTFVSDSGTEFDVVRKSWGYYGTPSMNRRLPDHGLRPALALSRGAVYLLLVEAGLEVEFSSYLDSQGMKLLAWLDTDAAVEELVSRLAQAHEE